MSKDAEFYDKSVTKFLCQSFAPFAGHLPYAILMKREAAMALTYGQTRVIHLH